MHCALRESLGYDAEKSVEGFFELWDQGDVSMEVSPPAFCEGPTYVLTFKSVSE